MSATDLAAVLVAFVTVAVVILVVVATVSLVRTMRATRRTLAQIERQLVPMVAELARTVDQANEDAEHLDEVIGAAQQLTAELDATNRFVDATVTNPLIRLVATLRGTARAVRGRNRRARRRARRKDRRRRQDDERTVSSRQAA